MINCTPQIMSFTIYPHNDFIQVPSPVTGLHTPCPALFDLACEVIAKPVPQVANRFIAYIYSRFMKQVFYIPKSDWKSHIHHDCKIDNFKTGFEVVE